MANDLVVQLGARLDKLSSDLNAAGDMADAAVDRIEAAFENLNPGLGGFSTIGTLATGATGALTALLASLVNVNGQLADLQRNAEYAGISAERFQRIQYAAGQGGVSSSQSADDLRHVARLLADAKENENSLTKLLDANNIKYKDRNGQVITLNQLLAVAGTLINKFDSIPEKVKAAQMLGLSEQWVEALRNGGKAFEDIASKADTAGGLIDNATVAKAAAFDRAWKQSSENLATQFKAVTADIAGWLDDLIDKAGALVEQALKSQGIASGSGQERFNAIADALDVLRKDSQGLPQDLEQVTRVIERMKSSGKGDPEIISGLELIQAKAKLAAEMLKQAADEQSRLNFPGGVPLPASRPSEANNADPNAAKLPKRKDGDEAADAYDRATESVVKHTARLVADTDATGKGAAAQAELRAEAQLYAAAAQAGIPITEKVKDQIQDLAQDAGEAAAALEKAKVASSISFGRQSAFLTQEDLQIAQQLRGIYGDNIPAAFQSSEAAALRVNSALKQISTIGQDINRGFLTDFTQQIRNGASAMDALRTAGVNALGRIADKLAQMAADNLWASAFGGSSGGLGSLLGGLFGSSSATSYAGQTGTINVGSYVMPTFASGTNYAPGGPSLVGENGPEIVNLPRGAQVIPNDVLRGGMGGSTSVPISISIDATGADAAGLARVQNEIASLKAELPARVVSAVQDAKKRRQLA